MAAVVSDTQSAIKLQSSCSSFVGLCLIELAFGGELYKGSARARVAFGSTKFVDRTVFVFLPSKPNTWRAWYNCPVHRDAVFFDSYCTYVRRGLVDLAKTSIVYVTFINPTSTYPTSSPGESAPCEFGSRGKHADATRAWHSTMTPLVQGYIPVSTTFVLSWWFE